MGIQESETAAKQLITQIDGLKTNPEIHITNLKLESRGDLRLAVTSLLRGKTVDEYFEIVTGLHAAFGKAKGNKQEQGRLLDISTLVMSIGEEDLGIDWS